jgi:hypothetical protein
MPLSDGESGKGFNPKNVEGLTTSRCCPEALVLAPERRSDATEGLGRGEGWKRPIEPLKCDANWFRQY